MSVPAFTRVEVTDASGAIRHAESASALNGTPVAVKRKLEAAVPASFCAEEDGACDWGGGGN